MMVSEINLERVLTASKNIYVEGLCNTAKREKAIEDAIAAIIADPAKCLSTSYIGIKNYSGFGDQREDHKYGMGPRHGNIVFRIGKFDRDATIGANEIYFLECARDFKGVEKSWNADQRYRNKLVGLSAAIKKLRDIRKLDEVLLKVLTSIDVESHVLAEVS